MEYRQKLPKLKSTYHLRHHHQQILNHHQRHQQQLDIQLNLVYQLALLFDYSMC
jgi:hypothetical protein